MSNELWVQLFVESQLPTGLFKIYLYWPIDHQKFKKNDTLQIM